MEVVVWEDGRWWLQCWCVRRVVMLLCALLLLLLCCRCCCSHGYSSPSHHCHFDYHHRPDPSPFPSNVGISLNEENRETIRINLVIVTDDPPRHPTPPPHLTPPHPTPLPTTLSPPIRPLPIFPSLLHPLPRPALVFSRHQFWYGTVTILRGEREVVGGRREIKVAEGDGEGKRGRLVRGGGEGAVLRRSRFQSRPTRFYRCLRRDCSCVI